MNTLLFLYLILGLSWMCMYAEPKYPVDVSYLVSDLKYSTEHGIKICEVQHGSLSAVDGDLFIAGGDGNISPQIADFFALLPLKKWAAGLLYPPLKRSLAATGWQIVTSWQALLKDPTFLEHASSSPVDPFYVSSYAGIVYADFEIVRNIDYYRTRYPGILFMNAATFPYWRDKYKMNALFDRNDELKQYKAEWRLYPKNYDQFLSERIQKELPAQMYVIKPRSEVLAVGVIVVARENLDDVLRAILEPSANLGKHPDKKYAYWMKNTDDSFIIEKYYESDYISFTPPVIKTTSCPTAFQYDATMRLAFILQCDGGTITYHNLGGFWKLPCKALGQDGTLNEERISYCKPPFYAAVEPELLNEVAVQMEKAMTLLYRVMLNEYSR